MQVIAALWGRLIPFTTWNYPRYQNITMSKLINGITNKASDEANASTFKTPTPFKYSAQ